MPQNKPMFIQFWNTYTNHAKINYKMLLTLRTPWWILLSSHAVTKNEPQAFNRSEWFFFLKIHKFGNRFTWKHVMKSLVTSIVNTAYLVTSLLYFYYCFASRFRDGIGNVPFKVYFENRNVLCISFFIIIKSNFEESVI